ncbi:hypothetical protein GCM10009790_07090 [Georgenia ruanii]
MAHGLGPEQLDRIRWQRPCGQDGEGTAVPGTEHGVELCVTGHHVGEPVGALEPEDSGSRGAPQIGVDKTHRGAGDGPAQRQVRGHARPAVTGGRRADDKLVALAARVGELQRGPDAAVTLRLHRPELRGDEWLTLGRPGMDGRAERRHLGDRPDVGNGPEAAVEVMPEQSQQQTGRGATCHAEKKVERHAR